MKTDEDHKIALCKSKKLDTFVTASGGGQSMGKGRKALPKGEIIVGQQTMFSMAKKMEAKEE